MRRLLTTVTALAVIGAGAWAVGPPTRAQDDPNDACVYCHEELVEHFEGNPHARLAEGDWFGQAMACASCHGDGSAHAQSGDPAAIRGYPGETPESDAALCLGCHTSAHSMGAWRASEHALAGLSCVSCHNPHWGYDGSQPAAGLGQRREQELYEGCFECHAEVRAQIHLPSRHPILEGKMNCGSCHDVHGTYDAQLKTHGRVNDLCFECHPRQQGPFIHQHEPVEEDCSICHAAHGAVADDLLKQTQPFLCLQCHEAHFHAGLAGSESPQPTVGNDTPPNPFLVRGMKHAFLTKCTQCHSSVHGTNGSSQGVSGRGGNLTR
jgi:DmsE family decaheme c-type cytochrome